MSHYKLDEAISRPKDSIGKAEDKTVSTMYDETGKINANLNQDSAAAISYTYRNDRAFKVKALKTGDFFNPLKNSFRYGLTKRDMTTNEPLFKLRTVSEKSFKNYVKFLKERHDSLLIIAERDK